LRDAGAFHQGGKDMSQRDGFASGFFAGAIVGSVVGGVVGALITQRRDLEVIEEESELTNGTGEAKKTNILKRRTMKAAENEGMEIETARRSLEDKIAQLNATIDEVRKQLGNVNTNSTQSISDRASLGDELR
jgi:predicted RNase H-like nuclease (RuvC/YqgF family)